MKTGINATCVCVPTDTQTAVTFPKSLQTAHAAEAFSRRHMPCLCRDALQGSTVQVGLQIRKGVGGTCPARAAARRPAMQLLLAALLTPAPLQHSSPATIPKETDPITARPPPPQPQKQLQQQLQLQHHQLPHQLHQQPQQQSPMSEWAPGASSTSPLLHHSPAQLLSSGHVASNNHATYSGLQPQPGLHLDSEQQQQQQQSLQEAQTGLMTLQQQQQQQQQQLLPQPQAQLPQQLHLQSQTWSNPPLQQQSQQNSGPALMSTSDEASAATLAANSNDVSLNADRGTTGVAAAEEATVPTACFEDVEQPELFGSFVEQLLDAAAWPQDSTATGMTDGLQSYTVQVWQVACQVDTLVDKFVGCTDAVETDKLLQLMPHALVDVLTH